MRKSIRQIFLLPFVSLFLTLVVFLILFNFLLNTLAEKKFEYEKTYLINIQKKFLKHEVNSIILGIDQLSKIGYSLAYTEIEKLLEMIKKHKPYRLMGIETFIQKHVTKDFFYWYKSDKFVYPKDLKESYVTVSDKKYKIIIYKDKKYLTTSTKIENGELGIAFSLDIVKNTIMKNIFKFLDKINAGKTSYIAMGQILNWNPGKDGVFGKIVYMPKRLSNLIGKNLSIYKPDIKGNYYRKKFFEHFKNGGDSLYVEYYFKNPKTGLFEPKISYFHIYKPYNWVIVKGFYNSQIEQIVEKNKKIIINNVKKLFILTTVILLIVSLITFIMAYIISKRIMKQILINYEKLKQRYEITQKELFRSFYFDDLTALPNRYKLLNDIKNYESICLIDIDDFSDINDIYGFDKGDEALKEVAEFLSSKYKRVYRIGSDEFAIGFNYKITEDEIKEIVNSYIVSNYIKITFTVGASYLKDKLFETAETALKMALKDSNLKYKIYDEKMQQKQIERLEQIQRLSKVLENEDVVPYYQCIVNQNGEAVKYEALMRIIIEGKVISPFHFMDFIKEAKLYNKFSRIMIKKVFKNLQKLDKPVSINLSFIDIANKDTKELIFDLLEKNQNKNIVFEILETENIEQFDIVIDFIMKVRKYGVKIAIDDFGTGYSNLVNILYLKPDFLKIDASLVKNIDNAMYEEIVRFIINFAKKFNIRTTAEFVSDKEKFEKLKELGIDEFQGFYFCEPRPIDELI